MTTTTPAAPAARPASPAPGSQPRPDRGAGPRSGLLTALTWVLAIGFFFPVLWMVLTAFKQENQAASDPPTWFFAPTLDQFRAVIESGAGVYFANSLIATGLSTLLVIALGVPASYALAIRPVKRTSDVLFFFMSTKMLPVVAVIVPIYVIAGGLHVLDAVWGLLGVDTVWRLRVLFTAMILSMAVWMVRSFFREVPGVVLVAASRDGAGPMRTLRSVLMPMVAPGLAATALICVIFAWNEFFFAL